MLSERIPAACPFFNPADLCGMECRMKCLVCGSDETEWLETIMENDTEGYETYACTACRSQTEYGIGIEKLVYTGNDNVFPYEKE